ncbi:vacuolar protein-sorting-associated protein 25 [Teleopsis dalmanni]|uniref:vacuolar protein-sorting-associated protein 25 n=1 Tax=Teleopsis dalmanni TaxID=139649 RepID=UPI0018CE8E46|nr:vacuolar protein-sorting-associated protein 25 [Teleopsis dalmanni]
MTEFNWPWEYSFPPFFTIQPNEETRHQQIKVWSNLFLKYFKHHNKFTVNVNETALPLFNNEEIKRHLSPASVLLILEELQKTGHASPQDKRRVEWLVHWHTLEEYSYMIYEWAQECGQVNTVCTLYEIANGENSENTPFRNIDETVLINALRVLEEKGKCELILMEDNNGVKFFN